MTIDFYYTARSAPCRSILILAKSLGLDLNLKPLNLQEKEQLKPEFVKLNPQHTVPTLNDNGFSIWESRAILIYLAEKYAKDDSLFPKDPQKRAVVIQRLFFDATTLYQRFADAYYPLMRGGAAPSEEQLKKIEEALEFLNTFLSESKYAAGDKLTVADFSLYATATTIQAVNSELFSKFLKVTEWLNKLKSTLPLESDHANVEAVRALFSSLIKK